MATTDASGAVVALSKPKHSRYHCIVSVHGIGEPKPNSTLMPVVEQISRLACTDMGGETLTLGGISDLKGWNPATRVFTTSAIRFSGIRTCDPRDKGPIWLQSRGTTENIFFADIHWADITNSAYEKVGEPLAHWTECLVNRVDRNRARHDPEGKSGRWWVMDFLHLLRSTILFLEKVLSWKAKGLSEMVFGRYLGDVQMYAESAYCRGQSVRAFHDTMQRVHAEIKDELAKIDKGATVEYTIIAHSLGTVLSMDALMLAHYDFAKPGKSGFLPFPGYGDAKDSSHLEWIDSVESFVTCGSPIDKFLTLWWYNYLYLNETGWIRKTGRAAPIKHYNFCEEQDPVGHRLDFARTALAFRQVFSSGVGGEAQYNDIVYSHSPIPGLAHTYYWKDESLFKLIYDLVVIGDKATGRPKDLTPANLDGFPLYKKDVHRNIQIIHFILIPALCVAAAHFSLYMALNSESWNAKGLGVIGLILSLIYGRTLLKLNIEWRRALKDDPGDRKPAAGTGAAEIGTAENGTDRLKSSLVSHDKDSVQGRGRLTTQIKFVWWFIAVSSWFGALLTTVSLFKGSKGALLQGFGIPVLLFTGAACLFFIRMRKRFKKFRGGPTAVAEAARKEDALTWVLEWLVVALALLPTALVLSAGLRDLLTPINEFFGSILPKALVPRDSESRLFFVTFFQVSALGWGELIVLHGRAKSRVNAGAKKADDIPAWQRDFAAYAKAS